MTPARRPGGALIELMVVTAVAAVLAGLLLAAVQKVRAVAARLGCQNNVKQLALAAHQYHDAVGAFPAGTRPFRPGATDEPYPLLAWQAALLPYLDQDPLWRRVAAGYHPHPVPIGLKPHPAAETVVPGFACPADARPHVAWTVPRFGPDFRIALTSYLGSAGIDSRRPDGVLFLGSRVRVGDVADGASQTLLAGERPPSPDLVYGWWHSGTGQGYTGSLDATIGAREENRLTHRPEYAACGPGPFHYRPGRVDDLCSAFHYWSPHPGGANFALCDGSVRFLPYSADAVLPALATRAGGEVADAP